MYVIFKVPPFHKNVARAIQKAPKFYFHDTGQVSGEQGVWARCQAWYINII